MFAIAASERLRIAVCGLGLVLLGPPSWTAAAPAAAALPPPPPPADEIDAGALRAAMRAGIACGADYLLSRAATNYMNFAADVLARRSIRRAYTVRYSKKMVEQPIYEYDYEDVLVAVEGESAAGGHQLRKTRRAVPGSQRQVGTRKVEGHVVDPNGPIVQEYPEVNQPEAWQKGFIGQNALTVYALLKCGVPQDHPVLSKTIDSLDNIVATYGYPDMTWDLAWLTAAYCHLKGAQYDRHREIMVNKLLDGQVVDGPGRGLWGPVSINVPLFAAMVACETTLTRALDEEKKRLEAAPNNRLLNKRVAETQAALDNWKNAYKRVTQQGLRFTKIEQPWIITEPNDPDLIRIYGLPYFIYNQAVVDIEDTALALHALRQAGDRGYLPAKTWRPVAPKSNILLPPPEPAMAILARCGAALAKRQQADGAWSEENLHQPLASFEALGFRQLEKEKILALKSQRSLLSTAQAAAALLDIGAIVGLDTLLGKFRYHLVRAQGRQRSAAEGYLENKTLGMPVARFLEPYDYFVKLPDLQRALDGISLDRPDLLRRLAYRLLLLQSIDGAWGKGLKTQYSSGQMAYWQEESRRAHEEAQEKLARDKRKPFDPALAWRQHTGWSQATTSVDASLVGTAYAMLFLQETLRLPAAAYWHDGDRSPTPPLVVRLAQFIRRKYLWTPGFLPVSPKSPAESVRGMTLILDSRGRLDAPESMALLKEAGLLIVDTADAQSYRQMETLLLAQFEGCKSGPVTKETPFLASFDGPTPVLMGLFDNQGALRAVFIPSANVTAAYLALKHHVGESFFAPDYPVNLENADHMIARNVALGNLVSRKPEPAPPAEPVAAIAPAPPAVAAPKTVRQEEAEPAAKGPKPQPPVVRPPAADETW